MSKKRRNLWLLIALTVVMGGALWLLLRGGGEEGHTHAHDVSDSDESGRQSGILVNEAQEDLQGLVFRNENAEYTAYLNETSGQVAFRELEGYPVNENFMEYVWFSVPQMLYQDFAVTDQVVVVVALDNNALALVKGCVDIVVEALARDLMEQLPEREARVITGIFGINQEAPQTLREVGESMNISHERVRQLRDQALRRIRKYNSKDFLQEKKDAFLAAINK